MIGTVVDMSRHTILHRAGTIPGSCYYILEGEVESFDSIASGSERIFRRSGPGALILLPAMMIRHELHLSFRTSCPTKVIKISRNQLQEYFLATPDFAARTVRAVSELYIDMMEALRQTADTVHTGPNRLDSFDEDLFTGLV